MFKRIITICAVLGAFPVLARADYAGHFGMNPRSMGLGGAYTAAANDVASLYYNPAGLVRMEGLTVGGGVLVGEPFLSEDSARLSLPGERSYYLHVGLPFSGKLKDSLAVGASLNMPWGTILETSLYKKHEPFFALYDASVRLLQLRLGAAARIPFEPLSFLTVGGSLQILGSMTGSIGFYAPYQRGLGGEATDPDLRLEAWAKMEVPTATFFTGGMMADLGEHWKVGATYRQAQYISVSLPISLNTRLSMNETTNIRIPVEGHAKYDAKYVPQQASLGVTYERDRLFLAMDLTWIDYSSFKAPVARVSLDTENMKKDPGIRMILGSDSLMEDPLEPTLDWRDALVPRVGAEYRALSWLLLRGGYSFERSPLVNTDFPIYDCDKHGIALGARASFLRPWGLVPGWLHMDLGVQEMLYAGRNIVGSDVGGHVFAVSAGFEVVFL